MKKLIMPLLLLSLYSCKVKQVKIAVPQDTDYSSRVIAIDTVGHNLCLYRIWSTAGNGSALTKCGCMVVGEKLEVNLFTK